MPSRIRFSFSCSFGTGYRVRGYSWGATGRGSGNREFLAGSGTFKFAILLTNPSGGLFCFQSYIRNSSTVPLNHLSPYLLPNAMLPFPQWSKATNTSKAVTLLMMPLDNACHCRLTLPTPLAKSQVWISKLIMPPPPPPPPRATSKIWSFLPLPGSHGSGLAT